MAIANNRSKRQPGRPKDDGTDRRKIILEAAMTEFGLKGYEGASLAAIARRSDITKAALLHHFQSKERLFVEVLKLRDVDALELISETAQAYENNVMPLIIMGHLPMDNFQGNPWDHLALMVNLARLNEQNLQQVRLFITVAAHATSQEGPGYEWLERHMKNTINLIAEGIEKGKEQGFCKPEAPSYRIARTIVAIMDGTQLQWTLSMYQDYEPWHVTGLTEELADYISMVRERYEIVPDK